MQFSYVSNCTSLRTNIFMLGCQANRQGKQQHEQTTEMVWPGKEILWRSSQVRKVQRQTPARSIITRILLPRLRQIRMIRTLRNKHDSPEVEISTWPGLDNCHALLLTRGGCLKKKGPQNGWVSCWFSLRNHNTPQNRGGRKFDCLRTVGNCERCGLNSASLRSEWRRPLRDISGSLPRCGTYFAPHCFSACWTGL